MHVLIHARWQFWIDSISIRQINVSFRVVCLFVDGKNVTAVSKDLQI